MRIVNTKGNRGIFIDSWVLDDSQYIHTPCQQSIAWEDRESVRAEAQRSHQSTWPNWHTTLPQVPVLTPRTQEHSPRNILSQINWEELIKRQNLFFSPQRIYYKQIQENIWKMLKCLETRQTTGFSNSVVQWGSLKDNLKVFQVEWNLKYDLRDCKCRWTVVTRSPVVLMLVKQMNALKSIITFVLHMCTCMVWTHMRICAHAQTCVHVSGIPQLT